MAAFVKIAEDTAGFLYKPIKKSLFPEPESQIGTTPPTAGPSPTTVMAAKRAEDDWLKRQRRATVMGGDYGPLNITTQKLGT